MYDEFNGLSTSVTVIFFRISSSSSTGEGENPGSSMRVGDVGLLVNGGSEETERRGSWFSGVCSSLFEIGVSLIFIGRESGGEERMIGF